MSNMKDQSTECLENSQPGTTKSIVTTVSQNGR